MNDAKRDEMLTMVRGYVERHRAERTRKQRVIEGILSFLQAEKQAKDDFYTALREGAGLKLLPSSVEETGLFAIACCGRIETIELTVHAHHVWECPRCDKVYALRIQQPEE